MHELRLETDGGFYEYPITEEISYPCVPGIQALYMRHDETVEKMGNSGFVRRDGERPALALGRGVSDQVGWHLLLDKLYMAPIIIGAVWFGLSGGLYAALLSMLFYAAHLWYFWPAHPMELVHHVGEATSFLVLGALAGLLISLDRRGSDRELRAKRKGEREKIASAIAALTETLSARDAETRNHSKRVAGLIEKFALYLGLPLKEVRSLYLAGLMHDIGKVGIPDDILLKADALTPEERRKIMEHPAMGEKILAPIGFVRVVEAIAAHHENLDGSGYPQGLSNDSIPVSGRILAIVDTYDALSTSRPYKDKIPEDEVRTIMATMAGKKLDPDLLEKFWLFMGCGDRVG